MPGAFQTTNIRIQTITDANIQQIAELFIRKYRGLYLDVQIVILPHPGLPTKEEDDGLDLLPLNK
jgi:hypothetical protein